MNPIPIELVVEDELSETVLRRVLDCANPRYVVGHVYGRSGFGYLRSTIASWNSASKGCPYLVLTDLDAHLCPSALISEWLRTPPHPNLLFRVAVREVESWLLADRVNLARYLGVPEGRMPLDVETLNDPKATLVNMARKSRFRVIRDSIVPRRGSTATQGPDYNNCLSEFVTQNWDVHSAAGRARSLSRTLDRLAAFRPYWQEA